MAGVELVAASDVEVLTGLGDTGMSGKTGRSMSGDTTTGTGGRHSRRKTQMCWHSQETVDHQGNY